MNVEINNKTYDVQEYTNQKLDTYYYKKQFIDYMEIPKACRVVGYVETDDNQRVGIVSPNRNKVILFIVVGIVALTLLMFLIVAIAQFVVNWQPKSDFVQTTVESTEFDADSGLVSGQLSNTEYILTYNKYCILDDNKVDISYVNIDKDATIRIEGDGITSADIKIAPNVKQEIMEVTTDNVKLPQRALLIVTIDGKDYNCPFVLNSKDTIDANNASVKENAEKQEDANSDSGEIDTEEYYNPSTFKNEERYFND